MNAPSNRGEREDRVEEEEERLRGEQGRKEAIDEKREQENEKGENKRERRYHKREGRINVRRRVEEDVILTDRGENKLEINKGWKMNEIIEMMKIWLEKKKILCIDLHLQASTGHVYMCHEFTSIPRKYDE
ncbi:hypothetical protein Pcinc_036186 [Petrolisthes cinctipes]|uniref:Uncharacterized protein n=1 Tax=Petrolisthes cinctipes TaxID=88211 RepID=A0AAE1BW71_PETCI|nr:hypothetical protein Pcinc_036186 [Petrolisthes cinctipes]